MLSHGSGVKCSGLQDPGERQLWQWLLEHRLTDMTIATEETDFKRQMSLCPSCSQGSVPGGSAGACPGGVCGQSSSHSEGNGRVSPQCGSASVSRGGAFGQSSSHIQCTRGTLALARHAEPQDSLQSLGSCRTCCPHALSGGWPGASCIGNSCHTQNTCLACHADGFSGA